MHGILYSVTVTNESVDIRSQGSTTLKVIAAGRDRSACVCCKIWRLRLTVQRHGILCKEPAGEEAEHVFQGPNHRNFQYFAAQR